MFAKREMAMTVKLCVQYSMTSMKVMRDRYLPLIGDAELTKKVTAVVDEMSEVIQHIAKRTET